MLFMHNNRYLPLTGLLTLFTYFVAACTPSPSWNFWPKNFVKFYIANNDPAEWECGTSGLKRNLVLVAPRKITTTARRVVDLTWHGHTDMPTASFEGLWVRRCAFINRTDWTRVSRALAMMTTAYDRPVGVLILMELCATLITASDSQSEKSTARFLPVTLSRNGLGRVVQFTCSAPLKSYSNQLWNVEFICSSSHHVHSYHSRSWIARNWNTANKIIE